MCRYWGSVIRNYNYGKLREDSICDYDHVKWASDYDHVKWASAMLFVYFIVTWFCHGWKCFLKNHFPVLVMVRNWACYDMQFHFVCVCVCVCWHYFVVSCSVLTLVNWLTITWCQWLSNENEFCKLSYKTLIKALNSSDWLSDSL